MKKLVLLDGMAIVYRAYYALNGSGRVNSKGMNTSAVLGFTTTMYDLIKKLQPTHMAVAFDWRGAQPVVQAGVTAVVRLAEKPVELLCVHLSDGRRKRDICDILQWCGLFDGNAGEQA